MTYATQTYTLDDARQPRSPRVYLIDKFIIERSFTIFYGYPGSLKSSLVLDAAMAVATGANFLPSLPGSLNNFPGYKTIQVPVFWIDIDNGDDVTAERISAFAETYNAPPGIPFFWMSYPNPSLKASDAKSMKILTDFLLGGYKPGWIIVDTLLRAAGVKDENASEMDAVMSNFHRLGQSLQCAVSVISHSKKENNGRPGNGLRGHSSIEGGVDSVFYVSRENNGDLIRVDNQKARRKPMEPFTARWTYLNDPANDELLEARFYWEPTMTPANKTQAAILNLCAQIVSILKKNGETNQTNLYKLIGGNRNNFNDAISKLVLDGSITSRPGQKNATLYQAV